MDSYFASCGIYELFRFSPLHCPKGGRSQQVIKSQNCLFFLGNKSIMRMAQAGVKLTTQVYEADALTIQPNLCAHYLFV